MRKFLFKQGVSGFVLLVSVVFSIIGILLYTISSTQGYLHGTAFNKMPIALPLIAAVLTIAIILVGNKFQRLVPYISIIIGDLIVITMCRFAIARIEIIQTLLIPNEHPTALYTAVYQSAAGMAFFGLSILAIAVAAFIGDFAKSAE